VPEGILRRLAYTDGPVAAFTAGPAVGPVPLTVQFDGSDSYDPNDHALEYDWTFGDGTSLLGQPTPSAQHTYTSAGEFTATLVVRNVIGEESDPVSLQLQPGNEAPEPVITLPQADFQPAVGQVVTLAGHATDPDEGPLPASALTWEVLLHHVSATQPETAHAHPYFMTTGVTTTQVIVPPPENLDAAAHSFLEVRLTATDLHGAMATVTQTVRPQLVNVTLNTAPSGLELLVNGEAFTTPIEATMWKNWTVLTTAPLTQTDASGAVWRFLAWSDGGADQHTLTASDDGTELIAFYDRHEPEPEPQPQWHLYLPVTIRP
jgi:hypothetical protein